MSEQDETSLVPYSVIFLQNGVTCVGNENDQQIAKYQGSHKYTVAALEADGYDWRKLPEVLGAPSL